MNSYISTEPLLGDFGYILVAFPNGSGHTVGRKRVLFGTFWSLFWSHCWTQDSTERFLVHFGRFSKTNLVTLLDAKQYWVIFWHILVAFPKRIWSHCWAQGSTFWYILVTILVTLLDANEYWVIFGTFWSLFRNESGHTVRREGEYRSHLSGKVLRLERGGQKWKSNLTPFFIWLLNGFPMHLISVWRSAKSRKKDVCCLRSEMRGRFWKKWVQSQLYKSSSRARPYLGFSIFGTFL
jgi:hypothetical protein